MIFFFWLNNSQFLYILRVWHFISLLEWKSRKFTYSRITWECELSFTIIYDQKKLYTCMNTYYCTHVFVMCLSTQRCEFSFHFFFFCSFWNRMAEMVYDCCSREEKRGCFLYSLDENATFPLFAASSIFTITDFVSCHVLVCVCEWVCVLMLLCFSIAN